MRKAHRFNSCWIRLVRQPPLIVLYLGVIYVPLRASLQVVSRSSLTESKRTTLQSFITCLLEKEGGQKGGANGVRQFRVSIITVARLCGHLTSVPVRAVYPGLLLTISELPSEGFVERTIGSVCLPMFWLRDRL